MKASNDTGRPMFTTEIDGDTLFLKADTLKSFRVLKESIIVPDRNASRKSKKTAAVSSENMQAEYPLDGIVDEKSHAFVSDSALNDSIVQNLDTFTTKNVSVDTIFTGIIDTIDYFIGDNNVKMYKTDMQAVCDSLVYNKSDSLFTLYSSPFIWSDSSHPVTDDPLDEFDENFLVTLTSSSNVVVGYVASHDHLMVDNDAESSVGFQAATQSRQEDGLVVAVTVRLSAASGKPIKVDLSPGPATPTPATPGQDYAVRADAADLQSGHGRSRS